MTMHDDETFGVEDGSYAPRRKWGCGVAALIVGLIGLGGVAVIACCGGLGYLGLNMTAQQVAEDLRDNPVVDEHFGSVTSIEVDWTKSLSAPDDELVYDVSGPKGRGELRVVSVTVDDEAEDVVSGTLETPDGMRHDLFPESESGSEKE